MPLRIRSLYFLTALILVSCGGPSIKTGIGCDTFKQDGPHGSNYRYSCVLTAENFKGTGDYNWRVTNATGPECGNGWNINSFLIDGNAYSANITLINNFLSITPSNSDIECKYTVSVSRYHAPNSQGIADQGTKEIKAKLKKR